MDCLEILIQGKASFFFFFFMTDLIKIMEQRKSTQSYVRHFHSSADDRFEQEIIHKYISVTPAGT